jgi:hypothetical protein
LPAQMLVGEPPIADVWSRHRWIDRSACRMRLRRDSCTLLAVQLKALGNTRGCIASSTMDPHGASCRRRLFRHRQSVRRSLPSGDGLRDRPLCQPSFMATGGVDTQRPGVCDAHLVRTLQTARLASLNSVARCPGSRNWSNRSCTRRDDSFSVHWITATSSLAACARTLAGHHRHPGVSWCPRGGGSSISSSAEAWRRLTATPLPVILFAP